MEPLSITFTISAFVAGIITFLAPCTLPLIPGYLSFISGASISDLQNPQKAAKVRLKIFFNGLFYVLGFTAVFVAFGSVLGLAGSGFEQYRPEMIKIGGVFVIFFGFLVAIPALAAVTKGKIDLTTLPGFRFFTKEWHLGLTKALKPGNPFSSFLFGVAFAVGWGACVGPILAVIFALALSSATAVQGTLLLLVFSAGLAIPFLVTALAVGWVAQRFMQFSSFLYWISLGGGLLIMLLGFTMITGDFVILNSLIFRFLNSIGLGQYEDALLDFL